MQRGALEAIVRGPGGPLRILSTHLEYYSALQRMTQVGHLLHLHEEACSHAARPRQSGEAGSPTEAVVRPASAILCGDCNFKPDSAEYARLTAPPARAGVPRWIDAWSACNPGQPHPPTFFVHDPGEPAYCCDFVFVTDDLVPSLRSIVMPQEIDASDHQPVVVTLED
jgi:endonuclease/exonuclease/phosphatase family metal-dependent hydrolase